MMKKLLTFTTILLVLSGGFLFAGPDTATLNISTTTPEVLLVRFTGTEDQTQSVTPTIYNDDLLDTDYGKFLPEVNLGKALEVLALHNWKIQAAANPLENTENDSYITYAVKKLDTNHFAAGTPTAGIGPTSGWAGNYGITIENFSYYESASATPDNTYPGAGTYTGDIVFTISAVN